MGQQHSAINGPSSLKHKFIIPFAVLCSTLFGPSWGQTSATTNIDPKTSGAVVHPILTCVVQHDANHFTAVFGYQNDSAEAISIPVGRSNTFRTPPEDRDQPTSFRPGQHLGVFDAGFSTKTAGAKRTENKLIWRLGNEVAIASPQSPRCPLKCPPNEGIDSEGQCLPLLHDTERVVKEDDVRDTGPDFASSQDAIKFILDTVRSEALGDVEVVSRTDSDEPAELSVTSTLAGPVFVPHEDGTIEVFEDKFALALGIFPYPASFFGRLACLPYLRH